MSNSKDELISELRTVLSGVMRNARGLRWINHIGGSNMIAFGALLTVARRPTA